jgi:hypothetical protein
MKFGIHLQADGEYQKFLKVVHDVGIENVRVHIDIDQDVEEIKKIANKLKRNKVQSYLTFITADAETFQVWGDKMKKMEEIIPLFSKRQVMGIGLVENVHEVLRRGQSRRGVPKNIIIDALNDLSKLIKDAGHKVVMPMRIADAQGGLWAKVDFDVYDIEVFVSGNASHAISRLQLNKPVWIGRAGRFGGYIRPSVQKSVVQRIKREAEGICDYAFLFSDKEVSKFHWSNSGVFNITAEEMGRLNGEIRKGTKVQ